jgi:hypothetical protein
MKIKSSRSQIVPATMALTHWIDHYDTAPPDWMADVDGQRDPEGRVRRHGLHGDLLAI